MKETFRMTEEAKATVKERYSVYSSLQLKGFEKEKRDGSVDKTNRAANGDK